jgi:hypothetical protein
MNMTDQDFTPDQQRLIDLLVDGELAEDERRQLLASFDARPDLWRRCAVAFLEAQSWGSELSVLARQQPRIDCEPSAQARRADLAPRAIVAAPRSWWHTASAGWPLAMAATFLLAFGLAWVIRQPGNVPSMADNTTAPVPRIGALADAGTPRKNPAAADAAPQSDRWDTVTLVMDDGVSGQREVELPVVESAATDDSWLDRAGPVVPFELRDALERLGHRVDERRQYLPLDLEDGRQLIVPVDNVEFTPVSARVYQ